MPRNVFKSKIDRTVALKIILRCCTLDFGSITLKSNALNYNYIRIFFNKITKIILNNKINLSIYGYFATVINYVTHFMKKLHILHLMKY